MANSYLKRNLSSIECKPKLLKDFLKDDSTNDFGLSYPLKPCKQVVQNQHLIAFKRAKSRATTSTILAIHKASEIFIKTLKYFPFSSPSILSRNISSKENDHKQRENTESNVKVKDILLWRSSRDLVVEESTPLDHCYSPSRHTTITTASTGSTPCSSALTSSSSSWCESDFSAEDYYGENSTKKANMLLEKSPKTTMENVISMSYRTINDREMTESFVNEGIVEKRTMEEIDEQYTPVSVLTSPFQEDREFNYHYGFENNQSKVEAQKQVNETEEKARQLLHHLKGTIVANSYDSLMQDSFLMDFFWEELSTNKIDENDELLEGKLVATAQDWLRGVQEGCYVWTEENKRENYVKEMEKGLKWTQHEEEKEEMALELEKLVLNSLVDEVLFDLITL